MAAISVSMFEPTLGKLNQAQNLLKEALEILTSMGARGQVVSLVRGGVPNTLGILSEFQDVEAYGAGLDRIFSDEGFQQFMARAQEAEALVPVRSVDYAEIPGMEVPFEEIESSGVILATLFKVREGKQEQSLERIKRSKDLFEKNGGKVRAMQSISSDPANLTATAVYFENFTEYGKSSAALNNDPDFQAFSAEIRGSDASSDFLRTSLYRVL